MARMSVVGSPGFGATPGGVSCVGAVTSGKPSSSMALVVFLRGCNVGGHRTFRPSRLAEQLKEQDVVNIGAAGTFVIRKRTSQARLRADVRRRVPFEADITICEGRDLIAAASDQGDAMRRYIMVSGLVFALFTFVQALRFMRQWPVRVASFDVPLWASAVAALVAAAMTFWAFRTARQADSRPDSGARMP